jgi:hypothetical protein
MVFNIRRKNTVILKHCSRKPEFEDVYPAKTVVPSWYKKAKPVLEDAPTPLRKSNTIKKCVPFLEALTFGYMLPLPVDLHVTQVDGLAFVEWPLGMEPDPVHFRDASIFQGFPVPSGYEETYPAWFTGNSLELPPGYSALVTHPLNRFDLPFLTLSGVIDSGILFEGNLPFFIKKGFEGLIPKGTPIAQVLPFKTDNWESIKDETLRERANLTVAKKLLTAFAWYKNNQWVKKTFN